MATDYWSSSGTTNDPSDHLRNVGQVITIEDARGAEESLVYKTFLTAFEDKYDSNWNETEVYARMDPIYTFQSTKRTISIGFDVPAYDTKEAVINMKKSMAVSRLLYPSYNVQSGVATLSAAPIFKVQFANLIQDAQTGGPLFGIIKSWSFKPKLDAGFFTQNSETGLASTVIVPKVLEVSFDLNVLHSHPLGYDSSTGNFRIDQPDSYPYSDPSLEAQTIAPSVYSDGLQSISPTQTDGPAQISEAQNTGMLDGAGGSG
jgi:hypothetical protein|tara:strand:+ start:2949 stop:3728 length:780 start_codon:yes stop_codon:yes gene_type:complete